MHSASKKARLLRGASNTTVRDTSIWRIEMSHQYPPARSAAVNGSGSRDHQRSQNTRIAPGPRLSQICCKPCGSSQAAKPLSNSVNPTPAAAAARLAYSCPFSQILTALQL